jgi:hypothetical protein
MDILNRIKRLVLRGNYHVTLKTQAELNEDGLRPLDAAEAILNAQSIKKTLRSRSPRRGFAGEKLYVIEGFSYTGTLIYTKGTIKKEAGEESFYLLVSSKISTYGDIT